MGVFVFVRDLKWAIGLVVSMFQIVIAPSKLPVAR